MKWDALRVCECTNALQLLLGRVVRLSGKSVSDMTYLVSNVTSLNFNSINSVE